MFSNTEKFFKGKCPHCRSIIEYNSVTFNAENDEGEMIATCESCNGKLRIMTKNPEESYISYGAHNDYSIDYEIGMASEHPTIENIIRIQGTLLDEKMFFDKNSKPIYMCDSCNQSLEKLAFNKLESIYFEIHDAYIKYTNFDIKGYGYDPDKSVFKLNFKCSCKLKYSAVFYTKYDHNGFKTSDLHLGNIINSKPLESVIDGTMAKDDCMELLKKTLVRWELLFDRILIITPFVGNQYLSDEKLIDTWFSILSQISSDKAKLITRTASLNMIKKAISNKIIDYDFLKEYRMSSLNIDQAIKLQPSHAKIYCGLSENYCEMIHGSANIAYGPSKEQISFRTFSTYRDLFDNFLGPLEIKDVVSSEYPNDSCNISNVYFDESIGFKTQQILNKDFANLLI